MTHQFHPTSLREYDIRGRVGETLFEADAYAIGRGFGTMIARGGGRRVAVGYDGRLSSPSMEAAVVRGLNESGVDALRVGLGPTPMLYFAVHHLAADGGIMITGSHNPVDFNGFKFMIGTAPFYGAQIQAIGTMAAAGDWDAGTGTAHEAPVENAYVDRLLLRWDGPALNVAWDAGNGAAGRVIERLTARLPGTHHLLFTEIDGNFPNHHPDPTEEKNLLDLRAAVAQNGCDLGLAFQLANIARDLSEDHAAQRCYLPSEWLAEADIPPGEELKPRYRNALAGLAGKLCELAAAHESSARIGARKLDLRQRWAILSAAGIYGDIARQVARRGTEAWDSRTVVGNWRKIGWIARALVQTSLPVTARHRRAAETRRFTYHQLATSPM